MDLTSHEASWQAVANAAEPAPRVRQERQPAILIALLFSACLLLDLAMAAAWPDAFKGAYLPQGTAYIVLGVRSSQVLLALALLCLSTHGLVWRGTICLGVIMGWDALLTRQWQLSPFPIIDELALTLPVLVWRLLGARVRHTVRTFPGALSGSELGRWQFRLSTLVGCLLLTGPVAFIANYQPVHTVAYFGWPQCLFAAPMGLGVAVAVATALGEGKRCSVALGIPLAYLLPLFIMFLNRYSGIGSFIVFPGCTSLLLMLLVLRAAGYRLQWRPPWR